MSLLPRYTLHALSVLLIAWIYAQGSRMIFASEAKVVFVDATVESGINFHHNSGITERRYVVETLGSGAAFFDYDNDGDLDLYIVNSGEVPGTGPDAPSRNTLYCNDGSGKFTDVTDMAGVGDTGYGIGVSAADYDNDGDPDLYITNYGRNILYENNGDGTFTDVTGRAGVGDIGCGTGSAFVDFDRDGDLDLYVANYVNPDMEAVESCAQDGIPAYCNPIYYDGAKDILYRNNGDGTFTDIMDEAILGSIRFDREGRGLGVTIADYNNDGLSDIYVANDKARNFLYQNNGNGTLTEVGMLVGVSYDEAGNTMAGMGVDSGDYDNDGWMDIFVTNFAYEFNTLYRNEGDFFTDVTEATGLARPGYFYVGFGTSFFDYDNDGDLDLFVANGHIMDTVKYFSDALTYPQPDQLFSNNGDGTFIDVSADSGAYFRSQHVGRGVTFGDYDNDGDTDIFIVNSNHPAILLRNDGGNRQHWLRIKTVGRQSNRDGIGTRIRIWHDNHKQMRDVRGGSSYCSTNDRRVLFGLGNSEVVDLVELRWPSGIVQQLNNVPANQQITVIEGETTDQDIHRIVNRGTD